MTGWVVKTGNLANVLDNEIDRVIGTCPMMNLVDKALARTLGLALQNSQP